MLYVLGRPNGAIRIWRLAVTLRISQTVEIQAGVYGELRNGNVRGLADSINLRRRSGASGTEAHGFGFVLKLNTGHVVLDQIV